jgi:hypothetical protein
MADIFLSYAREDRERARALANAFAAEGFSVFWERLVAAGQAWSKVIGEALSDASAVVVLWSVNSVRSDWVAAEADEGRREEKLIPVLLDDRRPPLGFLDLYAADLRHWDGSTDDPEFRSLLRAVSDLTGRTVARSPDRPAPGNVVHDDAARRYKPIRNAKKTIVFIAHASADKPRLKPMLITLIDQGFQLWVDRPQQIGLGPGYESRLASARIQYGHDWRESIRLAVAKADTVLACWSKDAVQGRREQFHYEVYMGMMQKKLNQCRIDDISLEDIGMPYTFDQIADLGQMTEGKYHPDLDYLMQDMAARRRARWRFW